MQTHRLPCCRLVFLALTGIIMLSDMQLSHSTHIKQWGDYLDSLEAKALIKSVSNHGQSYMEVTLAIYSIMPQGFAAVCPNINHYSLTDSPGKTQSLCGRIEILANSAKNTGDIQTVYTILVPRKFNINVSLVGFSEDFSNPSYTGCGLNDILITSDKEHWATFCGLPFRQTVIVGDRMAHVQSYHKVQKDEGHTLRLNFYFEAIPMQTRPHSQEHHMLFSKANDFYPSGMINYMIGSASDSSSNLKVYKLCERCQYGTVLSIERLQLLRKRYPILMDKTLHGVSILGYMMVNDDLTLSDFRRSPEIIRTFVSTDRLSMHQEIHQNILSNSRFHTVGGHSGFMLYYLNMYKLLVIGPRNLLRPLYGKLFHTNGNGPSLVEVRVWTIHGPQFANGQLQFGQLLVEIQKENCSREDTVVVYDGPPAGMLTSYGLTSPFAVLYNGRCTDILDAVKSSLGDLTISWIKRNVEKGVVGFAYRQQPVLCAQIPCTYTKLAVTNLEQTLVFEQAHRPSIQVFMFQASNDDNIQLRFQIQTPEVPHSIEGCLYSSLWLFDQSLRGLFCTHTNLMLLNSSSVQTKGLQLNRHAKLVVKSYPQIVRIKFSISFLTTKCLGLLNPCINSYAASPASHGRCFPQRIPGGAISISESQDCCFVLTYLENSLSTPVHCHFGFRHSPLGSLLRVDHTEFTAPHKISCCYEVSLSATLHIDSNVRFFREGCSRSVPRLKNQTFLTTGFDITVLRHLNVDGCSGIVAVTAEQSSLCLNLELPESVLRKMHGFDINVPLAHSCINTGARVHPHARIQISAYTNAFDIQIEYYFKMSGSIEIRKVDLFNVITFPINQHGRDWEWELGLPGLRNDFYWFIDSRKTRRHLVLPAASVKLHSSFVLQFRMKKLHPINLGTFHITPLMDSSLCPRSSYSLLSRCYTEIATGTLSWADASRACTGQGMHMLSLNSE